MEIWSPLIDGLWRYLFKHVSNNGSQEYNVFRVLQDGVRIRLNDANERLRVLPPVLGDWCVWSPDARYLACFFGGDPILDGYRFVARGRFEAVYHQPVVQYFCIWDRLAHAATYKQRMTHEYLAQVRVNHVPAREHTTLDVIAQGYLRLTMRKSNPEHKPDVILIGPDGNVVMRGAWSVRVHRTMPTKFKNRVFAVLCSSHRTAMLCKALQGQPQRRRSPRFLKHQNAVPLPLELWMLVFEFMF